MAAKIAEKLKIKIFYGWYIVGAAVVISTFLGGVTSYGFTALVNPIVATTGWSYAQVSLAMSLRGIESGVLSPLVGRIVDRYPARWLVFIGVLIIGIGFIALSRANNLAVYYISFMIISLGSTLGTHMTATATIVRWFKKNVGKATGMLAVSSAIGGSLTPVLVKLIDLFGWRNALVSITIAMLVVGLPLSFVYRTRPEDYGLVPDGKISNDPKIRLRTESYDYNTSVKDSIKTRAFWQMGLANTFQMLGVSAIILHVMPALTSTGIDRETASLISMSFTFLSIAPRIGFGWLSDTFRRTYVQAISIAMTCAGLFIFSQISSVSVWLAIPFIIIYGIGVGGVGLRASVARDYFGTSNFATIFGLQSIFVTAGSVIGQPLAGWVHDIRGTYDPIWLVLGGFNFVAAILMFTMPSPHRPAKG